MDKNRYQSNGPTIVALPPATRHAHQSSRRQIMPTRPVRFDDVKNAFHDCLTLSSTKMPPTGTDEIKNDTNDLGGDDIQTTPAPARPDLDSYRLGKWEEEEDKVTNDDGKLIESISPPATPATISSDVTQTCTKVIPDSFLKFLLHIARIPLKEEVNSSSGNDNIEGHQNNTHHVKMEGHRRIHSEPDATAKAASQRAHEILCLIQTSYDAISVGQEQMQILADDNRTDATMSFFAACAGGSNSIVDVDDMTEKMKLSNASDEKADSEYIDRELSSKSSSS